MVNEASFWAEAQRRVKDVYDGVVLLLRATRESHLAMMSHRFVCLGVPAHNLSEHFAKRLKGEVLAVASDDPCYALFGVASFANALNGYKVLQGVFAHEPQRALEFIEVWHDSLEFMHEQCKKKQKETAECN